MMRQPTAEEIAAIDAAKMRLHLAQSEYELQMWRLKEACGVPTYAAINDSKVWVNERDNSPIEDGQ